MNFKGILKGTAVSLITSFLALIIGAVFVYFNIFGEQTVGTGLFVFVLLGIFFGAFVAAKNAFSRIILNSLAVSGAFILLIIISSLSVNGGFTLHARTTALIISSLVCGVLGAMFGKN